MLWTLPRLLIALGASVGMVLTGLILWNSFTSLNLVLDKGIQDSPSQSVGGGHSTETAAAVSAETVLASTDEVFVNLRSLDQTEGHFLRIKLELELFEDGHRPLLEQRKSGVKDAIIQVSREQDFQSLSSLAGKLYFKELVVSRINEYLKSPAVREARFAAFYIQ